MRKFIKVILQVLDGTPAEYGKRQAGQSMVELVLVTPILIILLAGLVEIGWFANNYLSLLDVTRAGARRATVLRAEQSPRSVAWLRQYTYVPHSYLTGAETFYRMPYGVNDTDATRLEYRFTGDPAIDDTGACNFAYVDRLFYNEIVCTMIISMDPLDFNPANDIDDVIVSGFSVEMVDASRHSGQWLPADRPVAGDVPQMVVVGRYPTEANECDVIETSPGNFAVASREGRDPFDFNGNNVRDVFPQNGVDIVNNINDFTELAGYDARATNGDLLNAEKQVGFSLFGNHKIPGTYCIGSEWTMREVENFFNLPDYGLADNATRSMLPGQGMALVELYWQHEMLLQMPLLSPVFTAVGNSDGNMVIYVWAAFPLPEVEPFIVFPP